MRFSSLILLCLLLVSGHANAENVMMTRSYESFEATLQTIKKALESRGYTVAHEQRCDGGLKGFGYETDFYRVIFFGKAEEVRHWSKQQPEMIPYLPLKLAVIAEEDQVLVVSFNPEELALLFTDKELQIQFSRWKNDIDSIMHEITQPKG